MNSRSIIYIYSKFSNEKNIVRERPASVKRWAQAHQVQQAQSRILKDQERLLTHSKHKQNAIEAEAVVERSSSKTNNSKNNLKRRLYSKSLSNGPNSA